MYSYTDNYLIGTHEAEELRKSDVMEGGRDVEERDAIKCDGMEWYGTEEKRGPEREL